MMRLRSSLVAASMALALGVAVSLLSAATPGAAPATTAATRVGSVSGKVVDKDGKPAAGAQIRYTPVTTAPATAAAAGGRGAGRGRGMGNATSDDKGAFTLTDVPVGQVNVTATVTPADGSARQRGTTASPVEVKEMTETKIADPIKLADAPARGGAGGAGGMGGMTPPASAPATASRPAGN